MTHNPVQTQNLWVKEQYENLFQWDNWLILLDISNAIQHGFAQNRMAKPGQSLSVESADKRADKMEREWAKEHYSREPFAWTGSPSLTLLPAEAKVYLLGLLGVSKEETEEEPLYYG